LPPTKNYTEDELIALLQGRDETAFSYLYDNYSGALNGIITRMVDDRQVAEDILQEAFLKIWNNFLQYDPSKGRLFTWMVNLARNLTIDVLRSKGFKKQMKITKDENSVITYSDKTSMDGKIDTIGIKNQLLNLKPEQKNIIDLAYFYGYTQEEIAKSLQIPVGTVKTRMRAAIQELRKMMTTT
jgi:RNA polymerase sigma-70 factor (ECF subfamily)